MLLRRIQNEMKEWPIEIPKPELDILFEHNHTVKIAGMCTLVLKNYPFDAPRMRGVSFPMQRLDPVAWMLTVLARPVTLSRVPTWKIECFCCHSLSCPSNWTVSHLLHELAQEASFLDMYNQLKLTQITLPVSLPLEIVEYIVGCMKF